MLLLLHCLTMHLPQGSRFFYVACNLHPQHATMRCWCDNLQVGTLVPVDPKAMFMSVVQLVLAPVIVGTTLNQCFPKVSGTYAWKCVFRRFWQAEMICTTTAFCIVAYHPGGGGGGKE